jgi:hypothetical protein
VAGVLDILVDILFFNLYGAVITVLALLAAIPYGAWQGLRWLKERIGGSGDGDARTDR